MAHFAGGSGPPRGGGGGGGPPPSANNIDMAKIFVGGLSWQSTEESLKQHFERFGKVLNVEIMRDRNTGDPRGFAFVIFDEDKTVEIVLQNKPHEINNKTVDVKRAQARGMAPPSIHHHSHHHHHNNFAKQQQQNQQQQQQQQQDGGDGTSSVMSSSSAGAGGGGGGARSDSGLTPEQLRNKVFVGGLPLHVDRDELRSIFSQFGTVVDSIVMMDFHQQRSRGFGFVTFENDGSNGAQKALAAQPLQVAGKYVEIKLATPKGEMNNNNNAASHFKGGGASSQGGGGGGQASSQGGHYRGGGSGFNNNVPNAAILASMISSGTVSSQDYAGIASSYGRNGWKAGYGSFAFGAKGGGFTVAGWEGLSQLTPPERSGFSFDMLGEQDGMEGEEEAVGGYQQPQQQHYAHYHDNHSGTVPGMSVKRSTSPVPPSVNDGREIKRPRF